MNRRSDESLIAEAESLAGNDVHDVRSYICLYSNYANWLSDESWWDTGNREKDEADRKRCVESFDRTERILRAFVGDRRGGGKRPIRHIGREFEE